MVITINALSAKSLKDASKQVDKYANELANKNRIFMQELLNAGIAVIYDNLNGAGDSDAPTPDYPQGHVDYGGGNMTATLRLKGKDVMFVEFGAGVYYNGNPMRSTTDAMAGVVHIPAEVALNNTHCKTNSKCNQ